MIHALHKKAYASKGQSLTSALIQRTIDEAIEKKEALKKDRGKKKRHAM